MNNNRFESNQRYFTICVYTIIVVAVSCVIFRVVFHLGDTIDLIKNFMSNIASFLVGILISFIVSPFVNYIHDRILIKRLHIKNKKTTKILSILFAYIIVLGFIGICLVYVIPQLIASITDLSANIPAMYVAFSSWLRNLAYDWEFINNDIVNDVIDNLSPKIMEFSTNLVSQIIPWLYSASVAVVKWFITIIIAIVVSIYLLSDKKIIFHTIRRILYAIFSKSMADKLIDIAKNCNQIFTGYIIAKAIDSLIIGILCCFVMNLLSLPYSVLISVIVGITNMIPYFGPYIGAMPGIFILAVMDLRFGLIFAIMILAIQQFDGLILGPRLLGDSMGLRPILILFAITFGGAYFGVAGMFLGVPVIAVVQYLCDLWIEHRLREKNIVVKKLKEDSPNDHSRNIFVLLNNRLAQHSHMTNDVKNADKVNQESKEDGKTDDKNADKMNQESKEDSKTDDKNTDKVNQENKEDGDFDEKNKD
ncbi:MAG: AI-2E family transporter [Clostridiales bacterium]|nr:AI-2E family transporter [Clostridiales bacterium]